MPSTLLQPHYIKIHVVLQKKSGCGRKEDISEPNHSAECSVMRRWLKIGHISKIPHTYTHTFHRRLGFQKLQHELLQTPEI
jgi:hypothetical protein